MNTSKISARVFLTLLSMAVCLQGVSAAGLTILNVNGTAEVLKSTGQDGKLLLQVRNDAPFTLYNISFEPNSYITMQRIDQLASGSTATFNATITANVPTTQNLRIRGFYIAGAGQADPQSIDAFLTYDSGTDEYSLDKCSVSVIKGSTLTWHNNAGVTVNLIKYPDETPIPGGQISNTGQYSKIFPDVETFQYYFTIASFSITPVCQVNVLNNIGSINDPTLDAQLSLKVSIAADPTSISVSVPQRTYTIPYGTANGGALTITNTGANTAVNVHLEGEWFSFSENNFNLGAGQTKGISYTIIPVGLTTNQTNQTHQKAITFTGNFLNQSESFFITIPKAEIAGSPSSGNDTEYLKYLMEVFCPTFPHSFLCEQEPRVVTQYVNNVSDMEFNVTIKNRQFQDLARSYVALQEKFDTLNNLVKETSVIAAEAQNQTAQALVNMSLENAKQSQRNDDLQNSFWIMIMGGGAIVVVGVSIYLVYHFKFDKTEALMRKW